MIELPDLVAGGLAAGTLSALILGGGLIRSRRQRTVLDEELTTLRGQLKSAQGAFTTEIEHLAARRVTAAARQLTHPHVVVPGPVRPETAGTPAGIALEHALTALRGELTAQRTRIDAAARAGLRGATREIQAALYRLQDALRGLEQRYDDPELAQTLFALDHENEQSLRRAQVAAVVCGAWVGLAREESHVVDAVTGGQARLAGYHRVRVHNHLEPGTALVSHAVEPVAIIVAELLDNALRHSAPDTDVMVNLEHVHHGVCVTVDDAGVGMNQDERARAQRLVAGSDPILLTDLGDPPRMGLAAIGQLTRQFDLGVDVSSPSPYGGVRAVLRVASHLISHVNPAERPPAASAPRSTRTGPPTAAPDVTPAVPDATAAVPDRTDAAHDATAAVPDLSAAAHNASAAAPARDMAHGYGSEHDGPGPASGHQVPGDASGLPQRRRRGRAAAPAAPEPNRPARRPEDAAAALAALQYGTAAARDPRAADTADSESEPVRGPRAGNTEHTEHEGGAAR
ncbi:ATP-binding protein [Streptomyces olivochromogenes]|uniref:ATP-binding protein n=1 Tax=Streptomyces olivochromogenes TaxID=1963 RepID=UPI001F2F788B|nr:ATP-binding protein [Streptomyces olivochromogenes]